MTAHPHAVNGNMQRYLEDAKETNKPWRRWQFRASSPRLLHEWIDCSDEICWRPDWEYRRKPRTLRIGDREVAMPENVEFGFADGGDYFVRAWIRREQDAIAFHAALTAQGVSNGS